MTDLQPPIIRQFFSFSLRFFTAQQPSVSHSSAHELAGPGLIDLLFIFLLQTTDLQHDAA